MNKLYIFSIIIDENFEYEVTEVNNVKYIEIGLRYFIENYLENPNNVHFWEHNNNTLYIMRDGNYSDIKNIFIRIQNIEVSLVKGSSQKSHMVSPIDFRLSSYLLLLFNMDFREFNKQNSFNIVSKDRYLPTYKQ